MEHLFGSSAREAAAAPSSDRGASSIAGGVHRGSVQLGGRYALERELGRGGEASVFAATDLLLGRKVAVKLFHQQVLPPSTGRLEQIEARVAASLSHYALTTLLDSGVDAGPDGAPQLYMVMEYVPGENLRSRLRRGAMEASEACWLGFDLAEGLDYMHQTGYIHRDVKPANVLISSQRSVRPVVAKLTDFGIATAVGEPDLSQFTTGTAAYLSPEQVEGHDAVPASDVYSLGLVLLEAMTGRAEFQGGVSASAFERLTRDPQIPASVPDRTAALLRRMTVRPPDERIGLFDAAVELQQILVDDLLARRGRDLQRQPEPTNARSVDSVSGQAQRGLTTSARLAAHAAQAPMAAIVLQAADGPSLAAAIGWAEQPLALASAFTAPPTDARGTWTIPDASTLGPATGLPREIGAIAGAEIVAADRTALGVIYVCDRAPREFTPAQLAAVRDSAELIATDLQLRLAIRRVLFPDS